MSETPITPDEFRLRMKEIERERRYSGTHIEAEQTHVFLAGNTGVRPRG